MLDYALENVQVGFDYAASTLGLKFASAEKVGRIEIILGSLVEKQRVEKNGLRLFYRSADGMFKELMPTQWEFDRDATGKIILTLKTTIETTEVRFTPTVTTEI